MAEAAKKTAAKKAVEPEPEPAKEEAPVEAEEVKPEPVKKAAKAPEPEPAPEVHAAGYVLTDDRGWVLEEEEV